MADAQAGKAPLTVTALTRRIKSTLQGSFPAVVVEGEVSNLARPASGHLYFTIKDENAQISAVLFRGNQRGMSFAPRNGMLVRAHGEVTVYEKRGNYQLLARRLEQGGKGSLQAQFEALKKKLLEEGLFAQDRKQTLPLLPQHVGVVTSASGAAIRDILNVVYRRFPNLHLLLAPVMVQGPGAAPEIAAAIDRLNEIGGLDVLIVGRGGGSLEDLWAFNEEEVARAVARSRIPVISAVGHEVDFTICDFVADMRAPTPSAAAELVVGSKDAFEDRLVQLDRRMAAAIRQTLEVARHRLTKSAGSYVFREPAHAVAQYRQRLDMHQQRMRRELQAALQSAQQSMDWMGGRLQQFARAAVVAGRNELEQHRGRMVHALRMQRQAGAQDVKRLTMQLRALNPLAVLQRGYSITSLADGQILFRKDQVSDGDHIATRLADGVIISKVEHTEAECEKTTGPDA